MGQVTFGAPREVVLWLSQTFNIKTFVETGTNHAETTVWAANYFDSVITIEGYEPLYDAAVQAHSHRTNIQFIRGDSRQHLERIAKSLTEPAIFWLDAHWCGEHTFGNTDECPVLGEIEALNTSGVPHIILIDDARLFVAPPPAPHQASHWPDIAAVCRLLTTPERQRYVALHADVIIAVPEAARTLLVEFIRYQAMVNPVNLPQVTVPDADIPQAPHPVAMPQPVVQPEAPQHRVKKPFFQKVQREFKRILNK